MPLFNEVIDSFRNFVRDKKRRDALRKKHGREIKMFRFGYGQSVFIEIDPKWLIEQAREQGLELKVGEAHEFARKLCESLLYNWLPEEIKYFANEQYHKEDVDAGQ